MHSVIKIFAPLSLEIVFVGYDVTEERVSDLRRVFADKGLYVSCYITDKMYTGQLDHPDFDEYLTNQFLISNCDEQN